MSTLLYPVWNVTQASIRPPSVGQKKVSRHIVRSGQFLSSIYSGNGIGIGIGIDMGIGISDGDFGMTLEYFILRRAKTDE